MGKLSDDELKTFEALKKKLEEPDEPAGGARGEVVNITVDLADEAAVNRAIALGLLKRSDLEDDDDGGGEGEGGEGGADGGGGKKKTADATPKRRGYFGDA